MLPLLDRQLPCIVTIGHGWLAGWLAGWLPCLPASLELGLLTVPPPVPCWQLLDWSQADYQLPGHVLGVDGRLW
jgi:hypothetical protein